MQTLDSETILFELQSEIFLLKIKSDFRVDWNPVENEQVQHMLINVHHVDQPKIVSFGFGGFWR